LPYGVDHEACSSLRSGSLSIRVQRSLRNLGNIEKAPQAKKPEKRKRKDLPICRKEEVKKVHLFGS
ncbi:MAG: hypothetical protein KGN33_16905, partial [Paracoccaceae bacterium]|nr:hypothetical protein [Paracoccaceae bacterium]